MMPDDLAVYLESKGYTNVGRYVLPATPDAVVAIIPYAGRGVEHDFGAVDIKRELPRAQIVVRGAANDVKEPAERALAVCKELGKIQNQTINGFYYREFVVLQPPFWLRQDENKRHLHVFNVEAVKAI